LFERRTKTNRKNRVAKLKDLREKGEGGLRDDNYEGKCHRGRTKIKKRFLIKKEKASSAMVEKGGDIFP